MFFDDRKKAITTLMSKRSAKGDRLSGPAPMKNEVVKTEDGELDGRHIASQDAMAAFHEKSPRKFMEAMANFIDIHGSTPRDSGKEAGSSGD